ncbi:MAG: DUF2959 domain-containing protein [Syntrophales bacterium]|jgi:hypothetical protein|nr:DUF2959 domain-containing protein [Syntrophales bacterium]MDY0044148.1 DUF2959 family protein [Syntrophales bacterium]
MNIILSARISILIIFFIITIAGCQNVYYTAMEKIGVQKRDIMVNRVESAQTAQAEAKEQFRSALEKFSDLLNFQGEKLQDIYAELDSELRKSELKAEAVRKHISDVKDVADALFDEWKMELEQFSNQRLRQASERKLRETKQKYRRMITQMQKAEQSIDPVLTAFRDQVLFLKHNLNARAVASMQKEVKYVKNDIAVLIDEMEKSIKEADLFVTSLSDESS